MRLRFLILAVLVGALSTACACSAPPKSSSTLKSPSPAATFGVATRSFSSAALGVSFRYPAAWQPSTRGGVLKRLHEQEDGTVGFHAPTGEVGVGVDLIRPAKHAAPYGFGAADQSDLQSQRSSTGGSIVSSSLVTLDGLGLAEVEMVGGRAPGVVPWHFLELSSGGMGGDLATLDNSLLYLYVACPAKLWPAQRTTLLAILDSVRIGEPRG
jgi:hypothetical protein